MPAFALSSKNINQQLGSTDSRCTLQSLRPAPFIIHRPRVLPTGSRPRNAGPFALANPCTSGLRQVRVLPRFASRSQYYYLLIFQVNSETAATFVFYEQSIPSGIEPHPDDIDVAFVVFNVLVVNDFVHTDQL